MDPVADAVAARPMPAARVDFARPLVCLLGLPFDAIGMAEAVRRVRDAAFAGRRLWIATPNLNFAIAARTDAAFRDTVLQSDLSLADGMPLVWMARLLGLPIRERVAGADLFEALQAHEGPPLGVHLFGGPPGAAAQACARINERGGGLRCLGFDEAGHGSLDSMSDAATIARINASGAHFVVVALGAQKGQAWIGRNAARLSAPVLCHLGAVMNFAAGTLRRAPAWVRRCGLEWAWRIKEEPALWRRYGRDGLKVAGLLATRVLPDAIVSRLRRRRSGGDGVPVLEIERVAGATLLRPADARDGAALDAFRAALDDCARAPTRLTVDLSRLDRIGNAFAASLLLARGHFGAEGFTLRGAGHGARADLRRMLAAEPLLGED